MGVEPEVSGPWGYAIRQISSHNHSVSSLCVPSRKPQLFCRLSPNLLYPVYLCSLYRNKKGDEKETVICKKL